MKKIQAFQLNEIIPNGSKFLFKETKNVNNSQQGYHSYSEITHFYYEVPVVSKKKRSGK